MLMTVHGFDYNYLSLDVRHISILSHHHYEYRTALYIIEQADVATLIMESFNRGFQHTKCNVFLVQKQVATCKRIQTT